MKRERELEGRWREALTPAQVSAGVRPPGVSCLLTRFTLSHPEQTFEHRELKRSVERNRSGAEGASLQPRARRWSRGTEKTVAETYSASPYLKDVPDTVEAFS